MGKLFFCQVFFKTEFQGRGDFSFCLPPYPNPITILPTNGRYLLLEKMIIFPIQIILHNVFRYYYYYYYFSAKY